MAKDKKIPKKRAEQYEEKLAIKGTFADVIKVSVQPLSKPESKPETPKKKAKKK